MSSFALVGPPGSGKTTMACSATKAGYKIAVIDVDKKLHGMRNIQPLIASGQVHVIPVDSPLIEESLVERAAKPLSFPQKQPQGYLEIATIINSLHDDPVPADIIVLDSASRVASHLKRYMLFMAKKHHFEYSDWDSWYTIWDEITESFLSLPYEHQIITYHEKIVRDDVTGKIHMPVSIDGKYANEVGRYFSEMYAMEVVTPKAGKAEFRCRTVPDDKRVARTSYQLDTYIPSDLSLILPKKVIQ